MHNRKEIAGSRPGTSDENRAVAYQYPLLHNFLRAISTQLFESQREVLLGHRNWRVFLEKGGTAALADL
jgi:hypothetical protein